LPPVPMAPGISAPPAPPLPSVPPMPPMPPAPPAPPAVDSNVIRDELRKDGLIGKKDKGFQFQLNNKGLFVNGKKQSEALTKKYRELLDVPAGTNGKSSRTIQISVSE